MNLSQITIVLGLVALSVSIYGMLNQEKVKNWMLAFPRSNVWGYILMGVSTGWFLYNFNAENIADFARIQNLMLLLFLSVGVGTMLWVKDFLAVRGLSIFIILLAHSIVELTREVPSSARLVMVVLSYLYVISGIVFTIRPYIMRDVILWATYSVSRFKILLVARGVVGVILIVLGLTAYKGY